MALQVSLVVDPWWHPAGAQTPQPPRDSVALDSARSGRADTDTVPPDSGRRGPVHPVWGPLLIPGAYVALMVAAIAPAPLARWWGPAGPTRMALLDNHAAVHLSLGGQIEGPPTVASGIHAEVIRNGWHAQLRGEDFGRPPDILYVTARGGYLWRPKRYAAGGVTMGLVHASGDSRQQGVELGFPLFVGMRTGTIRVEPTYVLSPDGPLWSYHVQLEGHLPGERYVAGMSATGKSLPLVSEVRDDFAVQALRMSIGRRF